MSRTPNVALPLCSSEELKVMREIQIPPVRHFRSEAIPPIRVGLKVPDILGNGALFKFAVGGGDLNKVFDFFSRQVQQSPENAALLLDLALLHLLGQRQEESYRVQAQALEKQQLFRVVGTPGREIPTRLRVLAFVAPGDFTNNAPLEFILDGADIGLDVLYLVPGMPLPPVLPEHDVAFCAVNESVENLPILRRLAQLISVWPRPVMNDPEKIMHLSRDGVASLLSGVSEIYAPPVNRISFTNLWSIALGQISPRSFAPDVTFPILVRPTNSHGGKNLQKVESPEGLGAYLKKFEKGDFFITSFVDYQSEDGFFRKYRVAVFAGVPFLCHVALSDHWMVHYFNAGMTESAAKRAEEAYAMENFDEGFARRHQAAFENLYERLGLDYFVIDCSELPDGRLLLFEADTAMVIHAMDSPTLFPYKQKQMAKVFAAFRAMVDRTTSCFTKIQEELPAAQGLIGKAA